MEPCTFRPRPPKFFPKKFLVFLPKKTGSEKVSYTLSKKAPNFLERKPRKISELPYTSGNGTFLYLGKY